MHHILTLNAGSSSIKFALFDTAPDPAEIVRGQIEGLGDTPRIEAHAGADELCDESLDGTRFVDHETALSAILEFLETRFAGAEVTAVGHRIVHGGAGRSAPEVLDEASIVELERLVPLAPLHQPHNLSGVRAAHRAFPDAVQVACFDTAFHRSHDFVEETYALPREFYDEGVRRYGFHGLSYEFVAGDLTRIAPDIAKRRVIICHLGNGASLCALHEGRSVTTTMGFSPLDGLPMGTRCGRIDPGVVLYLMAQKGMGAGEISDLLYRRSGLKGLSGLSHDMRTLEQAGTPEARQAIAYFVARTRREIGSMTAVLGGLDALVFCGGIGENSATIRARLCNGFDWLGIALDAARNRDGETVISRDGTPVQLFIVRTNEELMIARHTATLLGRREGGGQP